MNFFQFKSAIAQYRLRLSGTYLPTFIRYCVKNDLYFLKLTPVNQFQYEATILPKDFARVKATAEQFNIEIEILNQTGLFYRLKSFLKRGHILLGVTIALFIVYFITNIVWKIEIVGVSQSVEKKIIEQLRKDGLYEGAFIQSLKSLIEIQDNVSQSVDELLFFRIERNGTNYYVRGVEKQGQSDVKDLQGKQIIAKKSGIIKQIFIKEGQALVQRNDFVKKGTKLVVSASELAESTDMIEKTLPENVSGDIYAYTWYELTVSAPLLFGKEHLSGDFIERYSVTFDKKTIPLFNQSKYPSTQYLQVSEPTQLYFLKWKLPITIIHHYYYEKKTELMIDNYLNVKNNLLQFTENYIGQQLGNNAEIEHFYILHESEENGKVKLKLYVNAIENIAQYVQ